MKKRPRGIILIIIAAVLIELFSAFQYYTAHDLLQKQFDYRAENEVRINAIITKGLLNQSEQTLVEHLWDIERTLPNADSTVEATVRIINRSPQAVGSCLAFVPNYYPNKGRLFEPYAYRRDGGIESDILGLDGQHDYTQHPAYRKVASELKPFWSDPYLYETDSERTLLTTFSYPVTDGEGRLVAVCGLDLSLQQVGDTLNSRHTYPSSFTLLLTEGGDIITKPTAQHPKAHDIEQVVRMINDPTTETKMSRTRRTTIITFRSEVDNEKAYVYFTYMKGNPHWQVAVVSYDDEVYGALYMMRLKVAMFMLLGFALLGFIIHRFAKSERKLHRVEVEQQRINSELHVAQNIQTQMLPGETLPGKDGDIVTLHGSLKPAREVGGDIYDYFMRDEKLYFCIGDVSGKGFASAMVMAETHARFRMASMREKNPAHIMQKLNEAACEGNESNMFVTLFIGILDLPTGRLRYCNAGHDGPYLIDSENHVEALEVKANIPIGLFDDFEYEPQQTSIKAGTTLFLYTDGLTEAKNSASEQFAMSRVETVLKQQAGQKPDVLAGAMVTEVDRFVGGAEQSDDLTMLVVRYTPRQEDDTQEEITITNEVGQVKELGTFVKSITEKLGIERSRARNIQLAVEEAVVNVISYAYPPGTTGDICIRAAYNKQTLKFVIIDSGSAFDPTEVAAADTSLNAEERPVGGLGILLVRELMDTINYERIDGQNTLTLSVNYSDNK